MSSRLAATLLALGAALAWSPASAKEENIGPLDPAAGTVSASLFPEPFDCPGTHEVSVWFAPFTVQPRFAPAQWLGVPARVRLDPDTAFIDVTIPLGSMAPGRHSGAVFYKCESCSEGACAGGVRMDVVHVEVAAPATFGASAADKDFGGLVDGQPVSIHDLTVNVLADIKKSSFMQLTGADAVIRELEGSYLDRALTSNALSDVTFVKTTGTTDKNGRLGTDRKPVDDEDVLPGNARYTRQEDAIVGVIEDE